MLAIEAADLHADRAGRRGEVEERANRHRLGNPYAIARGRAGERELGNRRESRPQGPAQPQRIRCDGQADPAPFRHADSDRRQAEPRHERRAAGEFAGARWSG